MKLSTIQKRNNLNEVHCHDSDVPGPGGACHENALALTALEECLLWMNKRVEDRAERQVLDTYNK